MKRGSVIFLGCVVGIFQSSFYESTYWNWYSDIDDWFDDQLSILILRVYLLKLMQPEVPLSVEEHFQSSFYESTYWNFRWRMMYPIIWMLSILILRVYLLKLLLRIEDRLHYHSFNPHFTSLPIETRSKNRIRSNNRITFNPHFTSLPIETGSRAIIEPGAIIFQSSFYESTYWNDASHTTLPLSKTTFNPHFTSLPIETIAMMKFA